MSSVFFRCDGNHSVGMGHVMRCLSIADSFAEIGCKVAFILADNSFITLINERGFEAVVLDSDYSDMESELGLWESRGIFSSKPVLLVVDSYYVTEKYLLNLKDKINGHGGKLVYIDDMVAFPYPCDVCVNYNAYGERGLYEELYTGHVSMMPKLLLGPTFAPLRAMFRDCAKRVQGRKVRDVLISTGGSDELHISLSVLKYFIKKRWMEERVYHFLIGGMNRDREEIISIASGPDIDKHVKLHENVSDMRELLERMDIAVSAAGSTLYEISACGIPLITYVTADNQIPGAEAFERLGLAVNLGDLRVPGSVEPGHVISGTLDDSAPERIVNAVEELAMDYERRVEIGRKMQDLIDGRGADRLVDKLLGMIRENKDV